MPTIEPQSEAIDASSPESVAPRLRMVLGLLGTLAFGLALFAVQGVQFQVVHYTAVAFERTSYFIPLGFAAVVFGVLLLSAWRCSRAPTWSARVSRFAAFLWPLCGCAPVAYFAFVGGRPSFTSAFLVVASLSAAAYSVGKAMDIHRPTRSGHVLALWSLAGLIVLLVVVHTRIQINFFEHFMVGHADLGHFTEELKNVLAGRGLRSDSFENTRLGWHFVPLLYLLVPGYALWPSPVYLMVVGALIVHITALPAYFLARRMSGSVTIGWMWAVAWLLLPSVGRLVYAGGYGFPWTNVTIPLIALMVAADLSGYRRTGMVTAVCLLLCRETAGAAVFGWGLFHLFFSPKSRRRGLLLCVVSLAYVLLCVTVIIPKFAQSEMYDRISLFGELGQSVGELVSSVFTHPDIVIARLFRPSSAYFLMMLLLPMACLPLLGWRVALACVPTLLPVFLLTNDDWLSIKFWHHAGILPFLFFAAIAAMRRGGRDQTEDDVESENRSNSVEHSDHHGHHAHRAGLGLVPSRICAMTWAVLLGCAMGHYLFGFSPISKSYEPMVASSFLNKPDPRLAFVHRFRCQVSHDRSILATERAATHFTDFRRIYTAGRRGALDAVDYVLIDQSDRHDPTGLADRVGELARDPRFRIWGRDGSIIVFERLAAHPVRPLS